MDWSRIVGLALVLALHFAVLLRLMVPPTAWPPASTKGAHGLTTAIDPPPDGLRVVFVEQAATVDPGDAALDAIVTPHPMSPAPPVRAASPTPPVMAPMSDAWAVATPATVESCDAEQPPPIADTSAPVVRLLRRDSPVALPAAVIADLRAIESEGRVFTFMAPGRAGAASAFRRRPTLPYTPTRFDADWRPVGTLGDDLLIPISEMLTYENKS